MTRRKRSTWETTWSRLGVSTAVGAWTLTPLMGFVVGDHQPSIEATALQMLVAVAFMLLAVAPRAFSWMVGVAKETVSALAHDSRHGEEAVARARRDMVTYDDLRQLAWDAGLPWVDPEGVITYGPPTPADEQVHLDLHTRRLEKQPEVTGPVRIDGYASGGIIASTSTWNKVVRDNLRETAIVRPTEPLPERAAETVAGDRFSYKVARNVAQTWTIGIDPNGDAYISPPQD